MFRCIVEALMIDIFRIALIIAGISVIVAAVIEWICHHVVIG
jgi:hypothetical protein